VICRPLEKQTRGGKGKIKKEKRVRTPIGGATDGPKSKKELKTDYKDALVCLGVRKEEETVTDNNTDRKQCL